MRTRQLARASGQTDFKARWSAHFTRRPARTTCFRIGSC